MGISTRGSESPYGRLPARVRCPDCHHEYLLAFSCRGRYFCASCHAKKVVQFATHLQENVLFPVPHRQYVFSIPKILRRYLPGDAKGIENLAQYIIRNTFSLTKLSYVENTCTVIYRSKMGHGGNKKNFQTFSALEFIAAITQHIPERMSQMVRYLGWYSNRMCGDRLKSEEAKGSAKKK